MLYGATAATYTTTLITFPPTFFLCVWGRNGCLGEEEEEEEEEDSMIVWWGGGGEGEWGDVEWEGGDGLYEGEVESARVGMPCK